jgi:hypothetical protein
VPLELEGLFLSGVLARLVLISNQAFLSSFQCAPEETTAHALAATNATTVLEIAFMAPQVCHSTDCQTVRPASFG